VAEDGALDKSCTDALSYVRTYEQLRGYHKQLQPNMVRRLPTHCTGLGMRSSSSSDAQPSYLTSTGLSCHPFLSLAHCLCLLHMPFCPASCGGCTVLTSFYFLNSSSAA
jgi:hypothetical protein